MVAEPTSVKSRNREFLDTYLDFGVGHYYTAAKLLCNRITGELTETEQLSIGLEVSALASAALDNLVTWYIGLGRWQPRGSEALLPDVLDQVHVGEAHRIEALKHVQTTRADEFCHDFGIPWTADDLRSRRVDAENWRYTVDQAKQNIARVLEDLSPAQARTPRAWVARHLNSIKHGLLIGAGTQDRIPAAKVLFEGGEPLDEAEPNELTIPTDPAVLNRLADLSGNAAIGLFYLVRLLYITAFGREPRSPAFVIIWQELHLVTGHGP